MARTILAALLLSACVVAACRAEFDYTADSIGIGLRRDLVAGDTITLSAGAYIPALNRGVDAFANWRILTDSEAPALVFVVDGVETSYVGGQHEVLVRAVGEGEAVVSAVDVVERIGEDAPFRDQCTITVSQRVEPVTPEPATAAPVTSAPTPTATATDTGSTPKPAPLSPSP